MKIILLDQNNYVGRPNWFVKLSKFFAASLIVLERPT